MKLFTKCISVTCVPIYGVMFRILTYFHTLYFGASCIHRNSIVWRSVIFARFPYLMEKRTRRISRYSYLLETFISSEYGLTISCHVTVFRQWPLDVIYFVYFLNFLIEFYSYLFHFFIQKSLYLFSQAGPLVSDVALMWTKMSFLPPFAMC